MAAVDAREHVPAGRAVLLDGQQPRAAFFEFWTGVLVNRVMHLGVWDYSAAPFNLLGQICLPFTLLWFPLCGIGILLDRGMRRALFGTPAPQLRWV